MIESLLTPSMQTARQAVSDQKMQTMTVTMEQGDLKKAAEAFESYFLAFMMKVMRQTVPETTVTANHMGELFQSFYDEEVSRQSARSGGIGLARFIETNMEAVLGESLRDRGTA